MAQYIRSKFGIDDLVRAKNGALLAQGGKPEIVQPGAPYARRFDVLVLCAYEIQPQLNYSDLLVIHAPMDDNYDFMAMEDISTAVQTAQVVSDQLRKGRRVLSTCHQGRNRSGLVSAMALCLTYGYKPSEAIQIVRLARMHALTNPQFVRLLLSAEG